MRNFLDKHRENLMYNSVPPPSQNRSLYEIMWKYKVEPERPQTTIWHMHFACWIPRATDMHSEYVILIASPLQQRLHKCISVLCYMYNACHVK